MAPKAFSDLIGQIYECAFAPEQWPATLARIEQNVGAVCSYLLIHDTTHDTTPGTPRIMRFPVGSDQGRPDAILHCALLKRRQAVRDNRPN